MSEAGSRAGSNAGSRAGSHAGSARPGSAAGSAKAGSAKAGSAAGSAKAGSAKAGSTAGSAVAGSAKAGSAAAAGPASRPGSRAGSNAGSKAGSKAGSRASQREAAVGDSGQPAGGASFAKAGMVRQGSMVMGGKKNPHKYNEKRDFKGVPRGTQNAGLGSTHFDVAAPRHLSGLNPLNTRHELLQSRLAVHSDVPAWVQKRDQAEARFNLALREESDRLAEKDTKDENNQTNQDIKDNWKAIKASLQERRERMQQSLKNSMDLSKKYLESEAKLMAGKAATMRHFFSFSIFVALSEDTLVLCYMCIHIYICVRVYNM